MLAQTTKNPSLDLLSSLKLIGMISGGIGILGIILPAIAYAPQGGFLPFTTYLSDMGATPVWPQVLFNAPMLMNVPLRYLFLVLLVLHLRQAGAGRGFAWAALIAGAISTSGTILLSAVPETLDAAIHEMGIPIFFLGVVVSQAVLGVTEWKLKTVPRLLPSLSFLVIAAYLTFFVLVMLYRGGLVGRSTPIFPEWLCAAALLAWLLAHALMLDKASAVAD
jgi:hypothetical membrane protein